MSREKTGSLSLPPRREAFAFSLARSHTAKNAPLPIFRSHDLPRSARQRQRTFDVKNTAAKRRFAARTPHDDVPMPQFYEKTKKFYERFLGAIFRKEQLSSGFLPFRIFDLVFIHKKMPDGSVGRFCVFSSVQGRTVPFAEMRKVSVSL